MTFRMFRIDRYLSRISRIFRICWCSPQIESHHHRRPDRQIDAESEIGTDQTVIPAQDAFHSNRPRRVESTLASLQISTACIQLTLEDEVEVLTSPRQSQKLRHSAVRRVAELKSKEDAVPQNEGKEEEPEDISHQCVASPPTILLPPSNQTFNPPPQRCHAHQPISVIRPLPKQPEYPMCHPNPDSQAPASMSSASLYPSTSSYASPSSKRTLRSGSQHHHPHPQLPPHIPPSTAPSPTPASPPAPSS
jgi:hypothetical protein